MSKPVLFWTIARSPYGDEFYVVGITTVRARLAWGTRADGSGAWHGRLENKVFGVSSLGQTFGRFGTETDAAAKLDAVRKLRAAARDQLIENDERRKRIVDDFDKAVTDLCGGAR